MTTGIERKISMYSSDDGSIYAAHMRDASKAPNESLALSLRERVEAGKT